MEPHTFVYSLQIVGEVIKILQPVYVEVTSRDGTKRNQTITITVTLNIEAIQREYENDRNALRGNYMPYDIFLATHIDEGFQDAFRNKMYHPDDGSEDYGISTTENIESILLFKRTKFYSYHIIQ